MNFLNKVVIILGSEGKIGKAFTRHIIKNGGSVSAVDKKNKKKISKKIITYINLKI